MSESTNSTSFWGSTNGEVIHWLRAGPVVSRETRRIALGMESEAMSSMANPAAFGLWAFAVGTWMMAVIGGGYLPAADLASFAPITLFITGFAQFIAGLMFFPRGNMFATTAFTCFGALHITTGTMFLLHYIGVIGPHSGMHLALGFLVESFAFIPFGLLLAILPANVLLILITGTTTIGAALIGVTEFYGGAAHLPVVGYAGGAALFADAGLAFYLGAAIVVNSTFGREVLPILGEV